VLPLLSFASESIGILSPSQSITVANTGTASLSVANISFSGPFTIAPGSTCSTPPVVLAAGAKCIENIAYLPVTVGLSSGSVIFGGRGIVPESILLRGTAVQTMTTVTLASDNLAPFVGQTITLTAIVSPAGVGTPSGAVSFYDGTTLLGSAQTLVAGSASIATAALLAGTHNLTAVYSGDPNFIPSSSAVLAESVVDFNFTITAGGTGGGSGSSGGTSQTVEPGQAVTYGFSVQPIGGTFSLPVALSATGLPQGATVTFNPQVIILGAGVVGFTMTIQTAATTAELPRTHSIGSSWGGGTIALGLLLLPFTKRRRGQAYWPRPIALCATLILSLAALGALAGCGTSNGFFGQNHQSYTVNVIGSAAGAGGATLQHFSTVVLTVQ
jgi:hypothetical protein